MDYKQLMEEARRARENAHAPYSHFSVGAAVLCGSGRIYGGCNVENSSYGATICAERAALCHAIAHGEKEFFGHRHPGWGGHLLPLRHLPPGAP